MLVTPLIAVSMGAFPLVFIPLSAIAPGAVNWVLTDVPSLIPSSGESKALLAGVNLTLLVILGPIVEEILFRGYLLQRWAKKWGTFWAVMWSSAAFAVLHFEIIGGFVFGVVCAMLYIEFRSLWVPIVVHSANNLVAAIMTLWGVTSINPWRSICGVWAA